MYIQEFILVIVVSFLKEIQGSRLIIKKNRQTKYTFLEQIFEARHVF